MIAKKYEPDSENSNNVSGNHKHSFIEGHDLTHPYFITLTLSK